MAELKTKSTAQSVEDFIADKVTDERVRDDCFGIIKIMKKVTGEKPAMWGPSIIGFGKYHYKYESGHEGDMCITGFSPRKGNIVLYIMLGLTETNALLKKLGKYKATKGCLYIKRLEDVDSNVLEKLIAQSVKEVQKKYS